MILIDTNIILRSKQSSSEHFERVTRKLIELTIKGEDLIICPQVIYEFYVVATRPVANNGLGLNYSQGLLEVNNLLETYSFIPEDSRVFPIWKGLIETFHVIGKPAHDLRLVAFMQVHSISKFYTLNKKDFRRFEPILELID